MMAYGWKKVLLGAAFVLPIGAGVGTQAATVTFSDINTAAGEFGAVTHGDDTLDIDVSAFLADTSNLAQGSGVAFDTIAFLVTADPGYTITAIKYTEGGFATTNASVTTAPIAEPTSVLSLLAGLGMVAVFVATRRLD